MSSETLSDQLTQDETHDPSIYYGPKPGESEVVDITTTAEKREGYAVEQLLYAGMGIDGEAPVLSIKPTNGGNAMLRVSEIKDGKYVNGSEMVILNAEQLKHFQAHLGSLIEQVELAPSFGKELDEA